MASNVIRCVKVESMTYVMDPPGSNDLPEKSESGCLMNLHRNRLSDQSSVAFKDNNVIRCGPSG